MRNSLALFGFLFLVACSSNEGDLFRSLSSDKTGLTFSNTVTESDRLNILDYLYFYNGGGVAVGDINNDGLPDIFLSANQGDNQLFLNKGDLNFEDISASAKILGGSDWNTGAIMVDINDDGWLDIYVNAVVGINGFDGYNELFINNGDNTFTESAKKYNLDLDTYSSSTAFLDYDLDGDLDLYVLNHAVHTQNSFGDVSLRNQRNYESGDRLLRNDGNTFTDVSEAAGIYGGINAYGLGIAVSDFNKDGYPDIYIGNDFHEDDYYYVNQGDGTFKESLKSFFGHTSRFSMGNDVADINHDGWPDLISLDMLPEDEKTLKASEGDDNIQTLKLRTERYGYHYQFTRNMLYINQENSPFLETALYSGVAATDWSWSALIEDFNQDGHQDIFVSNGIPKRPNDIDFIRFVSSDKIQNKINETKLVDQQALELMPSGYTRNYIYEGTETLKFIDQSPNWIPNDTLVSGATAYGDLDGDGDLDLVVSNLNNEVSLLENTSDSPNYLTIKLEQSQPNRNAIGAKVSVYHQGKLYYKELYPVRGFQASSDPLLHFSLPNSNTVDSLSVIWPDTSVQSIKNIGLGQQLTIKKDIANPANATIVRGNDDLFENITDKVNLRLEHREDGYIDFNRQKLMPFQAGDRGPAFTTGDWNNDGTTDVFIGGSKYTPSQLLLQQDGVFIDAGIQVIKNDSIQEAVAAAMIDIDNNGRNDLILGNGGADFFGDSDPLLDIVYLQSADSVSKQPIEGLFNNATVIEMADIDNDGDQDVFVGNHIITSDYGRSPDSYLLINEGGKLRVSDDTTFAALGMVTDATFADIDADNDLDLVVVGEWMSPKIFLNVNGEFQADTPMSNTLNGLWQSIQPFDIDADGDLDLLLGNWGLNSKFIASENSPMKMYYGDLDRNGQSETILAYQKNGSYYPLNNLDELSSQLIFLKKKYTSYTAFAGQTIAQIFDKETLMESTILEVKELASGVLMNNEGSFSFQPFDESLQLSPIMDFVVYDFDNDQQEEVLAGGNYFGVTPYHGRFDTFPGALIDQDGSVTSTNQLGLDMSLKSVRHLEIIDYNSRPHLIVVYNDERVELFELKK